MSDTQEDSEQNRQGWWRKFTKFCRESGFKPLVFLGAFIENFGVEATITLIFGALTGALIVYMSPCYNRLPFIPLRVVASSLPQDFNFLYSSFVTNGGVLVLSNPPVYKYVNKADQDFLESRLGQLTDVPRTNLQKYDIVSLGFTKTIEDAAFTHIIGSGEQYIGLGEAMGLKDLAIFFYNHNIKPITISQSRFNFPNENAILLGGWISNYQATKVITKNPAYFRCWSIPCRTHDGAVYINGKKKYQQVLRLNGASLELQEDYAVITKLMNPLNKSKTVIICAGINSQGTEAACRIISEEESLKKLKESIIGQYGRMPEWFQIVIKVSVVDGQPQDDWEVVDIEVIKKTPIVNTVGYKN